METDEKLSDKMKRLEDISNIKLQPKKPVIIRLDGRAFSKFTKGLEKPFDEDISYIFQLTALELASEIQNAKFIYSQSDEINILLTDWDKDTTDTWYAYRIQKLTSISASMTTLLFNKYIEEIIEQYGSTIYPFDKGFDLPEYITERQRKLIKWEVRKNKAVFDSRVFNLEVEDVVPYFIYRQKDAIRNSLSSLAQKYFSYKQLVGVKTEDKKQMILDKTNIDFDKLSRLQQVGFAVYKDNNKWIVDTELSEFMTNRDFIERWLK